MRRRRLLWQLYPSYLLITLASLVAVGWFASRSIEQFFVESVRTDLQEQAQMVDSLLGDGVVEGDATRLQAALTPISQATSARITVISPSGEVVYESSTTEKLRNHEDRPEIMAALADRVGTATRMSETTGQEMMYLAIPVRRQGKIAGVVRTAVPYVSIADKMHGIQVKLATTGLGIAAVAALVLWLVSRRITRPLEEMRLGAERFARGDLGAKLLVPASAEMGELAETLNKMAEQLEERIRMIVRQGTEQDAVLASMVEGVLAVDVEQRVISLNRAAATLLGNTQLEATGRNLQEVIRNADLRRFVTQALEASHPVEGDIVMHGDNDRVLQAHGTALRDTRGRGIGAVIVLNDVTGFRRLESIRRDFVANVSHELKTPITSIKGFVETLLEGAIDNRADAERFLQIVAKQADRLNAIIEDLLSLSKIEQNEDAGDVELVQARVRDVLEAALHDCEAKAGERQVEIHLDCDERVEVKANPPLLEQAVVNLLDNAIKYSEPGGRVRLQAAANNGDIVISVRDTGCGIPAEHLSRVFERFYRVDKARSRTQGGTGLGLSIVKHIVNAHHGRVTVESTPGRGSTFSILLPR